MLKIFKLFEIEDPYKIEKSLKLLGIKTVKNESYILNEISKYIFGVSKSISKSCKDRNFDINYDYENYFPDFLKYNINLNRDDIDWWEFNSILNAILKDNNSNMSIIIKYRTYEKPSSNAKTQEQKQHRFNLEMKRKYALPNPKSLENGFQKLWDYTEQKVGEIKE